MQPESQNPEQPSTASDSQNSTACPNCRAMMPFGMRFCRLCGFRLGEGVEEYTETVRLGNRPPGTATAGAGPQFGVHDWGAMAPAHSSQVELGKKKRKGKGPHWIVWLILAIVIASVAGGSFLRPFRMSIGGSSGSGSGAQTSKVGASDFIGVDGGVMIESTTPVDGPLDKAGLVGGDVVTSFDGQVIQSENDLRKQIAATPVGKTVEVLYTRDGEAKKAALTVVSADELERLTDIAEGIPDGFLGIDELERVAVPGTNIYGVQLGNVSDNRPAKMADLRVGDIVIEFNGVPIRTPGELGARIDRTTPYSTVKVVVMRGSERIPIDVKVGIDD